MATLNTPIDFIVNMAVELLFFIFKFIFFSFLITLPFFYDLNVKFRYYFKFFVFYVLLAFTSIILLPFTEWKFSKCFKNVVASKLCIFITTVLHSRWKVTGLENLKIQKPCVFIANRQNSFDIIGIFEIWSHLDNCVIIADNKVYSSPLSLALSPCYSFFHKCLNLERTRHVQTSQVIQENVNIWIFLDEMQKLQNDIFHFVIKKHMPIVPVVTSTYYFIDEQRKVFHPGNVALEVLPQRSTEHCSVDDVSIIIKEIQSTIVNTFIDQSKKITPLSLKELHDCYIT